MTNYSVWGNSPAPGDFTIYTDGTPSIACMNRFYVTDPGMPDGKIVGGKLWIPDVAGTVPPQVRMQWYNDGYAQGTPTAEKIVDITAAKGSWQTIMLDTPIPVAAPGVLMSVVTKFEPEAYDDTYFYGANARGNNSWVRSEEYDGLYWSEFDGNSAYYGQGYRLPWNGNLSQSSVGTVGYGIDIILNDNYQGPGDEDSVYAQLKSAGHDIEYFVVAL